VRRTLAIAAFAAVLLGVGAFSPLRSWLAAALEVAHRAGPLGALLYAALFVPAALLLLPSAPLAVGAGHAFGPVEGTVVAVLGTTLGATVAFEAGRHLGGDGVKRALARSRRLAPFSRALAHAGFEVVLWLRLSPLVPFSLLNYGFGTTGLRARDYAAATLLGLLPGSALYALLGSLLPSIGPGGPEGGQRLAAAAGAVALSAVSALAARLRLPRLLGRTAPRGLPEEGPAQSQALPE